MENTEHPDTLYQFEFKGRTGEYFGIWIVNLLLTILTLGIYSAWAKVRTNRYFYGNTLIAGSAFDYTAEPTKILKGRIIAVFLLIIYQVLGNFYPTVAALGLPLLFLLVPAIYVVSMAFRMRYSSWRGISFNFQKDFKGAYWLFSPIFLYLVISALIPYLLGLTPEDIANSSEDSENAESLLVYFIATFSLFLIFASFFPLWQKKYYEYIGNRVGFGHANLSLKLETRSFYGMYAKGGGLVFLGFIPMTVVVILMSMFLADGNANINLIMLIAFPLILLPYVISYAYVQTRLRNTLYSSIRFPGIRFESTLSIKRMTWLYFTNVLAMIFSIGLAIPWAKIRLANYRAERMTMTASNLDNVISKANQEEDAKADAVSDIFDFDIGL